MSILVGDCVTCEQYGNGIVEAIWGQFASVQFSRNGPQHIPVSKLTSLDEKERYRLAVLELNEAKKKEETRLSDRLTWEIKRDELWYEIRKQLKDDYLHVESYFQISCSDFISFTEFEIEKISFVKLWISENTHRDKDGNTQILDDEQVAAIAKVNGHVQVVARAGSGKTTTLVNRAFFLLKHCGVNAPEMLLLAFNRKAAHEIRKKLLFLMHSDIESVFATELDRRILHLGKQQRKDRDTVEADVIDFVSANTNITLPHVMTFHALARSVVFSDLHQRGIQAPDLLIDSEFDNSQSKAFQEVIDDHLNMPAYRNEIRDLMLAHFREDWEKITEGCYDKTKYEFLQFRRSLPRESLNGEPVKSFGEKIIADFLFEHSIPYKYERNHWWDGINYQPDFTLFKTDKSGVVIEYFGLKGDVAYDKVTEDKREYWRKKENWNLIEVFPQDITVNGADSVLLVLKECLEEHGFSCVKLSEDEIWHKVRGRAIDRFSMAMKGFVGLCRKQSLDSSGLKNLIDKYTPISDVEKMFLLLALRFYTSYINRLAGMSEEDFDGLMQRASDAINSGNVEFRSKSGDGDLTLLRHIFIDEFQDFSSLFNQLIQSIRNRNVKIELFCVGDDWQAINGFAGSDLRFFENFSENIGTSQRLNISRNYRSSKAIVDIGNALMNGRGMPAMPGKKIDAKDKKYSDQVIIVDKNIFEPTLIETGRHAGDIITPIVLRLANEALNSGLDVVMLCRKNHLPWYVNFNDEDKTQGIEGYLNHVRSFFSKELKGRISISTAHKYKGLQKSVVILLDAVARCYPLIHPDWAFSRILGNSPEKITDEERRLLYVALTRAIYKLVVITDGKSKSPFLEDLEQTGHYSAINWTDYPPMNGLESQRLLVRVSSQKKTIGGGTFPIKDLLHASKFSFNSIHKYWEKDFPVNGFSVDAMKEAIWSTAAKGIEVQIYDESNSIFANYLVDYGIWYCLLDRLDMLCVPKQDSSIMPVNQANSIFSVEDYSIEYLLGFVVDHDKYGKGEIFSIDDERNTCRVRFGNEGELELNAKNLSSIRPPWRIDNIKLSEVFKAYRVEIDSL